MNSHAWCHYGKKPAFVIDQIPESEPFPAFGTGRAGLE
jgi:hypothetical protein